MRVSCCLLFWGLNKNGFPPTCAHSHEHQMLQRQRIGKTGRWAAFLFGRDVDDSPCHQPIFTNVPSPFNQTPLLLFSFLCSLFSALFSALFSLSPSSSLSLPRFHPISFNHKKEKEKNRHHVNQLGKAPAPAKEKGKAGKGVCGDEGLHGQAAMGNPKTHGRPRKPFNYDPQRPTSARQHTSLVLCIHSLLLFFSSFHSLSLLLLILLA